MFTLVVMAGGVGSRYGGVKQLAPVGTRGEAFLNFTIADAVAAGASKAVIVVRSQIESAVRRHVEAHMRSSVVGGLDVVYVRQDEFGPPRDKPWGTAHAALAAASEVSGPFMICNADDYYGTESLAVLGRSLSGISDGEALLCGYRLGFTLPESGAVSRGVCTIEEDYLLSIVEHHGVIRTGDGTIVSGNPEAVLDDDMIVSMNLWASRMPCSTGRKTNSHYSWPSTATIPKQSAYSLLWWLRKWPMALSVCVSKRPETTGPASLIRRTL